MDESVEDLAVAERLPGSGGKKARREPSGRREFSLWERVEISLIAWAGYLGVLLIGRSLRWEIIGRDNYQEARRLARSVVVTFWHCQIFPAIWYWRGHRMMVMVSQNFDGEYTARALHQHGYAAARGSSSRRGSRALVEMIRALRRGWEGAVTPDGPRGPRFAAKPGVVQLAQHTSAAILCFHIAPRKSWVLRKSWDQTEIPRPFSRVAILIAPPILVPRGADAEEQARKLQQVQATLDELVRRGEEWKSGAA